MENRGVITRLVMTLRGGDRPKNAHKEFPDVSVMPRMAEPWLLFRKPLEGRVHLRKWGRTSALGKQAILIKSSRTPLSEKKIAMKPRLPKWSTLPIVILDPFAGSGSTLAAARLGKLSAFLRSIGSRENGNTSCKGQVSRYTHCWRSLYAVLVQRSGARAKLAA